jgi:elongation factor Tu
MSKQKFERTKPQVNIGTIGHVDTREVDADGGDHEGVGGEGDGGVRGVPTRSTRRGGAGAWDHDRDGARRIPDEDRHYAHVDCRVTRTTIKNMITGAAQMDGAILAGVGGGRAMRRRGSILLAVRSAFPYIVVFLKRWTWWTIRSCWTWWSWRSGSC